MNNLDLRDFETKIRVRQLKLEDYDNLIELQKKCFPGMQNWGKDQIECQIRIFPEGQLCVEFENQIVATSSSLIVDFDLYEEWHNWKTLSDNGYIRNHIPDGDTLYGIEIMVDPEFRGLKLARRLYDARKEIARKKNLQQIIIGGRIPGYNKHADRLSAREYIDHVMSKKPIRSRVDGSSCQWFHSQASDSELFPFRQRFSRIRHLSRMTNLDYVDETKPPFPGRFSCSPLHCPIFDATHNRI